MVSPTKAPVAAKKMALKPKTMALKKLPPKKLVQVSHAAPTSKGLKSKMQTLLTKKTKIALKGKPLVLAQTGSHNKAEVENFAKALESMTSLNGIK